VSFTANPETVQSGQATLLSWEATGVDGVDIEPGVGLGPAKGMTMVRPVATTTYELMAGPSMNPIRKALTVTVEGGPPRIDSFTAMPETIMLGQTAHLSWSCSNATQVTIDNSVGNQPATGSVDVRPMTTTTYHLTATSQDGSATNAVTVVVASGNQPVIQSFTASPQTVAPNDPVVLNWTTQNASAVTIDNGVGGEPINGTTTVHPVHSTNYTLTAVGPGGSASLSVQVTVNNTGNPTIARFDSTPATIMPGGSATLTWEADNASSARIDPGIGPVDPKSTVAVMPSQTTIYTLTAAGNGQQVTAMTTVTVSAPNAPVVLAFAATPMAVVSGGSTTLSWRTANATSVDIDQSVGMGLAAMGTKQASPTQNTTYTLTAHGAGGASATQSVTVQVASPPPAATFTAQPTSINSGQSATLSWNATNATGVMIDNGIGAQPPSGTTMVSPMQTTNYTLVATGPGGTSRAMATVSVAASGAPVIQSFAATPQQIAPGAQATLAWSTQGAISVTIDNGIGMKGASGSVGVSPPTTTTYTLNASGPGGTASAQATLTVASPSGLTCSQPFVVDASGSYSGNTLTSVDHISEVSACTGFPETGPDLAYRISLAAGDRIRATLHPGDPVWDGALYLLSDCMNVSTSCLAGSDSGTPDEQIDFTAAAAGVFYLIVDGYAGAGGPFALTVDLIPAAVPNDLCAGAIDVGAGGTFTGSTQAAHNDYDPGSGGCTGFSETGPDVAYRVSLQAGDRLVASLDAPWDSALYVLTDCGSPASSCAAGSDSGNPEHVDFTAMSAGTYFLIVDGYGTAAGAFLLDVRVSPPVSGGDSCTDPVQVPAGGGSFQSTTAGLMSPYAPSTSCTGAAEPGPERVYGITAGAGDVVTAAADFAAGVDGALFVFSDCANLTTCLAGADRAGPGGSEFLRFVGSAAGHYYLIVGGADASGGMHNLDVSEYTGNGCANAAPLDLTGAPEFMSTAGKINNYSPNSGGCTGFTEAGPDRAYSVNLRAGDQVNATVTPDGSYDVALYLVSNCSDINGSCIAGVDRSTSGPETLGAVVAQAGLYYLIVDGFDAGAGGTGTIRAGIAHGDTCGDAYQVGPTGGTFQGTTAGYANDYGSTDPATSCTGFAQQGADVAFQVTLDAGKSLDATLDSTWDSALYLITDCSASATTCVAGSDSGNPEHVTYTNSTGAAQTYFLIVSSWRLDPTNSGPYTLTIGIQ
jgi:hypothetical protein